MELCKVSSFDVVFDVKILKYDIANMVVQK